MNSIPTKENYVRVRDMEGNLFVCPMDGLSSKGRVQEEDLDDCFENDVVGRYAGRLTIIEPTD